MKYIPVFYTALMAARNFGGFSPSAYKPKQLVDHWQEDMDFPLAFIEPQPVSTEQLSLAHDCNYVKGVLTGRLDNGFGNKLQEVADSLPYTSGSCSLLLSMF